MKTLTTIMLLVSVSAFAGDLPLQDHLELEIKEKRQNVDMGYEVLIEAPELLEKNSKAIIYFTNLSRGSGRIAAAFVRTPAFEAAYAQYLKDDAQHTAYLDRLARESGRSGMLGYQSKVQMWVKVQPYGIENYTVGGRDLKIDTFKVLSICDRYFKVCKEVEKKESGVMSKVTNWFK
jgi:hypothetical protein